MNQADDMQRVAANILAKHDYSGGQLVRVEAALAAIEEALCPSVSQAGQGVEEQASELLARIYEAQGRKEAAYTLRNVGPLGSMLEAEHAVVTAFLAALSHRAPSGEDRPDVGELYAAATSLDGLARTLIDRHADVVKRYAALFRRAAKAIDYLEARHLMAPSGEWEGVREALVPFANLRIREDAWPDDYQVQVYMPVGAESGLSLRDFRRARLVLAALPPPGEAQRVDMGEVERIRREAFEEAAKLAEGTKAYDDNLQKSAGCGTTGERIAAAIRALPSTPKQEE